MRRLPLTFFTVGLLALAIPVGTRAQDARSGEAAEPSDAAKRAAALAKVRQHVAGDGVRLASSDWGSLEFSLYTSIRYLNQQWLDKTYTDSTGFTTELDRREDLQFQKVLIYFKGWLGVPQFRYLTYVWTSNASQGLGAQVVVAGNLTYSFNDHIRVGVGIGGLPTTRTTRGNFPFWIKQDSRTISEEYFRGSYTTGVWAWGDITKSLHYRVMAGNNLSQLGIDAGQLAMGLNAWSGALWWTTREYGAYEGLGDLEHHDRPSGSVAGSFTRSREDRQSQPGTEDPENSQLRLSDGRLLFSADLLAPGVQIEKATYRMASIDGSFKYRGLAVEGGVFRRWLDDFQADGPLPLTSLDDHGFEIQVSGMAMPHTLMVYGYGSKVYGDYGDPWDAGIGVNYYPFGNRVLRINGEVIQVSRSPVGNLSSPLIVGANGTVFVANLELFF